MTVEEFAKATGKRVVEGEKEVAKTGESGIIEKNKTESGNKAVHIVGKIDRKIYSCITEDIATDERIQHIKDRHPNDFERFYHYISEIIENPDYILQANKPDTAFVLKEIESGG